MDRDLQAILSALKKSSFRSRFALTEKDREYIRQKGMETIRSHAFDFIRDRLAPAVPRKDGRQTPWKGHPVFVAQHATATCCRKCLARWHHIEKGQALSEGEVMYVVSLLMAWIEGQAKGRGKGSR